MNGARFVHDRLEEHGWEVLIADADEGQGLGAVGVQDRQDRRARPGHAVGRAIWSPRSGCPTRASAASVSSRASGCTWWRHRTTLKNRIHAGAGGLGAPVPGLGSVWPRRSRVARPSCRSPTRGERNIDVSLALIDDLDLQIAALTVAAQAPGRRSSLHPAAGDRAGDRLDQRATRSPPRSATSSRFAVAGEVCAATPVCARGCGSPAPRRQRVARSRSQGPSTCAGRCSRPR